MSPRPVPISRIVPLNGPTVGPEDPVHVRVWLAETVPPEASAAELVEALNPTQAVTLEVWDARPVIVEHLRSLGLHIRLQGNTALVEALPIAKIHEVFAALAGESFGGWLGLDANRSVLPASQQPDAERLSEMGPNAAFLVFSLYDGNIEITASGKIAAGIRSLHRL